MLEFEEEHARSYNELVRCPVLELCCMAADLGAAGGQQQQQQQAAAACLIACRNKGICVPGQPCCYCACLTEASFEGASRSFRLPLYSARN